ncbi:MAG TPA: sodium:proton antiporter [Chthonomonadaceae bacterium]|nr:sodium:proton antiporter [Chthonomonadaceae bacterium]
MGFNVENIEFLLLIAAIVAILARRLRLPYTVGLVLAGGALAFLPISFELPLTKELIFRALLPPLIFDAAFRLHWQDLRKDFLVILILATVGVLISAGVITLGMRVFAGWEAASALLFGVLISATDPVAVIALFKEQGITGRLHRLVEAESLFNDGTAAVAFNIALAIAEGGTVTVYSAARSFFFVISLGLLCGALVGGFLLALAGRTEDHLAEITFTSVAAYGSFFLAENFHGSGVLATLTAGLLMGNVGPMGALSEKGREAVDSFWEYAGFVANSLIFLLIGMHEAHQHFGLVWRAVLLAIPLVLFGRAASVSLSSALFHFSRWRIQRTHQTILIWGGLRGALALALVSGLPPQAPQRETILITAFAVVAFSIIVQGVTISPLLRRLGELPQPQPED